jgi:hypothetical protein
MRPESWVCSFSGCQIEVLSDNGGSNRIHIVSRLFCSFGAFWTAQQMLFQQRKFDFVFHNTKLILFEIVIADVLYAS